MKKTLQIYVVEDSQILQGLLNSAIAAAGAEVCGRSANADEAVEDIFAFNPDVVLIDISLKSGSGFDVLKALKEHNLAPDAIKLVLTNHPEYRQVCILLGANRVFDKSIEMSQALAFIGDLVVQNDHDAHTARAQQPALT
jgi:two-component system, OmpR family, response regulator